MLSRGSQAYWITGIENKTDTTEQGFFPSNLPFLSRNPRQSGSKARDNPKNICCCLRLFLDFSKIPTSQTVVSWYVILCTWAWKQIADGAKHLFYPLSAFPFWSSCFFKLSTLGNYSLQALQTGSQSALNGIFTEVNGLLDPLSGLA